MAKETSKEAEDKIQQLQLIEQNMQNFLMQRQQFQSQLLELESALEELEKTENAFKIVGNIMISTEKEELKKDIQQKKEMLDLRIKNIEKQETTLKDKAKKLQEEALKGIKE